MQSEQVTTKPIVSDQVYNLYRTPFFKNETRILKTPGCGLVIERAELPEGLPILQQGKTGGLCPEVQGRAAP